MMLGNTCVEFATHLEHLSIPPDSLPYAAIRPYHSIKSMPPSRPVLRHRRGRPGNDNRGWAAKNDGRQIQSEVETSEPACHGGGGSGAPPRLLLRDGSDLRANPPAFRRGRDLLERGSALQHRPDAPGTGGEKRRRRGRRHSTRVLHDHRNGRYRDGTCWNEGIHDFKWS